MGVLLVLTAAPGGALPAENLHVAYLTGLYPGGDEIHLATASLVSDEALVWPAAVAGDIPARRLEILGTGGDLTSPAGMGPWDSR